MKWALEAAGHWWTWGKCYSWSTQRWREPGVSGPSPASVVEEADCTQWKELGCMHSLLLQIQLWRREAENGRTFLQRTHYETDTVSSEVLWSARQDADFTNK